jgi:hypothetical protein
MRKHLFSSFLVTVVVISVSIKPAQAQNSSPYWSLAGNSNATSSSSKLGTTNAYALRLTTNNTTRLYISPSAGYVGIGTTSPAAQLQVNAPLGKTPLKLLINGSTRLMASQNGGLTVGNGTAPPSQGLYVSGNVGIGTATPTAKLHVFKGSAGTVTAYADAPLVVENATHSYINILAPDASETGILFGKPSNNISGGIIYSNPSLINGFQFRTNGNINRMVLTGEGKLGVGTTAPIAETHIVHAFGSISHGLRINHVSTFGNYFWNFYVQSSGDLELATQNGIKGIFRAVDGVYSPSDRALKKDFEKVQNILPKIMQLDVEKYHFIEEKEAQTKHFGMMAQDVITLFPEIVLHSKFDGDKDTWLMNYSVFGILAIKAIQEQQLQIQELAEKNKEIDVLKEQNNNQQQQIDELRKMVLDLKNGANTLTSISAHLEQNTPNPATGNTTIRYQVPVNANSAHLTVTNAKGQLVKTIAITNRGAGQVEINIAALASGAYNYTLWVDNKQADTKRFVIAR